jgi:hypothetical protein
MAKDFIVPVSITTTGWVWVTADSKEHAAEKAREMDLDVADLQDGSEDRNVHDTEIEEG